MIAAISLIGGGTTAYTLSPNVLLRPQFATVRHASGRVIMADANDIDMVNTPAWGDDREGKPFGAADRDENNYDGRPYAAFRQAGTVRNAVEAFQPRSINDATIPSPQYIETEDEPWHATCRPLNVLTKGTLVGAEDSALPFIGAEDRLNDVLRKAKTVEEVNAAIEACKKEGGRAGSPAFKAAEKVVKAFAKGDDDAVAKARPKAPKANTKPQGKGWDGMERQVGKTHDNSVA